MTAIFVLAAGLTFGLIVDAEDAAPCQDPDGLVRVPAGERTSVEGNGYRVALAEPLDRPIGLMVSPLTIRGMTYRDTPIAAGIGVRVRFVEVATEPADARGSSCAVRDVVVPEDSGRLELSLALANSFCDHLVQRRGADFDDPPEQVAGTQSNDGSYLSFMVPGAGDWACIDRPRTKAEIEADERWLAGHLKSLIDFSDRVQRYAELDPSHDAGSLSMLFLILLIISVTSALWLLSVARRWFVDNFSSARIRDRALAVGQMNWWAVAWWFPSRAVKWAWSKWRSQHSRAPEQPATPQAAATPTAEETGPVLAATAQGWPNRSLDSFSLVYERDTLLVATSAEQWRRIRRSDIRDLILEKTFWWDPLAAVAALFFIRWYCDYQDTHIVPVLIVLAILLFGACKLRYITIVHGATGCVLRVRLPAERIEVFLDWLDDGNDGELEGVLIDRAAIFKRRAAMSFLSVSPLGHLHELLGAMYGSLGLRQFVLRYYPAVRIDLPDISSSYTTQQMTDRVVEAFERHGLIDALFFNLLLKDRPPKYTPWIRACADAWNIRIDEDAPAAPAAPAAPPSKAPRS